MQGGRILFVDDEPKVLEGIENMLFDAPDDWEVDFAVGGNEALSKLEDATFDVLVTDMRMPGMDGAELLAAAQQKYPATIRIVLSGHTEEEAAQRAMPLAHEFLSKPCTDELLIGTLERALALVDRFSDVALRRALGQIGSLPTRPATYFKIKNLIDDNAGIDEVAEVVESECSLAAKILHVANTAFYSCGRATSGIRDAVVLLGLSTTAALVLAVETYDSVEVPEWLDVDALQEHSTEVARLAAGLVPAEDKNDALLGGLMHDVGSLLIGMHFSEGGLAAADASADRWTRAERSELEHLGFAHTGIGAHLLRLWQLSEETSRGVERHHLVGLDDRRPVELAVFAADYATHIPEPNADDALLSADEVEAVEAARELRASLV